MLTTYKRTKDKQSRTGEERVTWEYYDHMDELYGTCRVGSVPPSTIVSTALFPQAPSSSSLSPSQTAQVQQQRQQQNTTTPAAPTPCTAVERFLMEQVGELQVKVDHIIRLLQSRHTPGPAEAITLPMLPLGSAEELSIFDNKLKTDGVFRLKVIGQLSLAGGKSVKDTVWRVCSRVFTHQLATQLNWCGRGQKTGIKARPIHQVILGAVMANPAAPSTEAEVETAIKNWLRLSGDREGGRRRRT
ncbi:uncharacterized protein LOC134457567 [Engraulis encrasicolus]|uniref:uncharacterized protein LOC134457567 n=1 Tax=Engraulis encrasicolus TaxID=184585 RepID=UPI002FD30020